MQLRNRHAVRPAAEREAGIARLNNLTGVWSAPLPDSVI